MQNQAGGSRFFWGGIEAYFGAVAKISGATQCGSQHSTMWAINQPGADFLNAEPR
jgi:hypothetical protein